jgi:hypothetical protein
MSARSIVTRKRDHRDDRGKSGSNDMVNDGPEALREPKKTCASSVHPSHLPSLVSENRFLTVSVQCYSQRFRFR